ncbi:uncharacterized protein AB675_8335 [Cyphellophora attinorum]|uniref:WKF domain-containing protein n=1 Tax=Cyphellophora attinorum TaxID=1664694 RepID=A0A0N0NR30_9EURO|nr:uncharacterized protein AB675_8335 [Phialophora attinorum]KPI44621.1 hypothetical protein AB675_8335 [Phialophora attinorum]
MSSTHVPAWKRLGLKLKNAKETATPASIQNTHQPPSKKRRIDRRNSTAETPVHIKANGSSESPINGHEPVRDPKPKKQVSFTSDTKATDGDTAVSITPSEAIASDGNDKSVSKKPKKAKKQATAPSPGKSQDVLNYLTEYYRSNDTWKFNKNRETWILKHLFDTAAIQTTYNLPLAQYLYGIKSQNARDRLRMRCIAEGAKLGDEDNERNGESDVRTVPGAKAAVEIFVNDTEVVLEGSELDKLFQRTPRTALVLWALDPAAGATNAGLSTADKSKTGIAGSGDAARKKRKNRTAVVEYSSSSSSESSESESESSSDSSSESSDSES